MKFGILVLGFSLASVAWGQTSAISSVVDNLGQPRVAPGAVVTIYGSFPTGGRSNFTVTFGGVNGYVTVAANDGKLNRAFEIDVQVPTEIPLGNSSVVVSYSGGATPPFPVTIVPVDPVLSFDAFSAFVHTSGLSVQPAAPAAPGEPSLASSRDSGPPTPPCRPGLNQPISLLRLRPLPLQSAEWRPR